MKYPDSLRAPDFHHSLALNCQLLSDLEKQHSNAFGLIAPSDCYVVTQISLKYTHVETTDKPFLSVAETTRYC